MKKVISIVLTIVMLTAMCIGFAGCGNSNEYNVGICQLMVHDSLDQATQGFIDALTEAMEAEGKTFEPKEEKSDSLLKMEMPQGVKKDKKSKKSKAKDTTPENGDTEK